MTIKKYIPAAIVAMSALVVAVGFVLSPALASAQTTPSPMWSNQLRNADPNSNGHGVMAGGRMGAQPGVFGTVTAINGTTLTVSGKQSRAFGAASSTSGTPTQTPPANIIYTVDASSATVRKNNATSTVASIAIGDTVAIRGTVSGTSVTAISIFDGVTSMMHGGNGGRGGQSMGGMGSSTRMMASSTRSMASPITGNGQPVIAGSVSAMSGNTLTVINKSNVTYSVDITNAKIVLGQATITVSSVAVGDNVIVQGTVSGTSVTASSVIDQKAGATAGVPSTTGGQGGQAPAPRGGIFGAIGSFFSHIFGF